MDPCSYERQRIRQWLNTETIILVRGKIHGLHLNCSSFYDINPEFHLDFTHSVSQMGFPDISRTNYINRKPSHKHVNHCFQRSLINPDFGLTSPHSYLCWIPSLVLYTVQEGSPTTFPVLSLPIRPPLIPTPFQKKDEQSKSSQLRW